MGSTALYGLGAVGTLLPFVFFARDATGSFAGASAVLAASAFGNAVGAPIRGRIVDRHGARRTLPLFALGIAAAMGALLAAGEAGLGLAVLVPLGFVEGFAGQTPGVVLRSIWGRVTEGHERSTAFALLTVMHEVTNLSGPLVGALLLLFLAPVAAAGICTGVAAMAVVWFARTPTVDDDERAEPRPIFSAGPLVSSGFRALLAMSFFYGVLFGQLEDIVLPAFAVEHGSRSSAGFPLSAIAVGIAIGGLAAGLRPWRRMPGELLPAFSAVALIGTIPALAAGSIAGMTALMLVFGLAVAPVTTLQFAVIDDLTPARSGAEAFSWFTSVALAGAAAGAIAAGKVVDVHDAGTA